MKIGIIEASGKSGGFLINEALWLGYEVTAIVRDKNRVAAKEISVIERDIFAIDADDIKGFAAVIDAFRAPEGKEEQHVTSLEHLIRILKQLPAVRLMVVGGAGGLYTDSGKTTLLMDSPGFPAAALPTASNMKKTFERLKASEINWTYLSPAAEFDPQGKRTGGHQMGEDALIFNSEGKSYISYADYAIAMIDELKNRAYARKRFCVVSEKS